MNAHKEVLYSVLDLAPIFKGGRAADSFRNTLDLAQHAERLGYHRFWLAEHHNIPSVASAATAVLIGYVAAGTSRIRVGAGGIMLPNHSPLVIAEQFGTLESLYPKRIDLGLGRAPGGDRRTAAALRRSLGSSADTFPEDVLELQRYFDQPTPGQSVLAIPGAGLNVPLYLLGSSDFSAALAARLGLPFAFASHFAPGYLHLALEIYRKEFVASKALQRPHAMVTVNAFAAETDSEARRSFTSLQQQFLNIIRHVRSEVPPPVDSMDGVWTDSERIHVEAMTKYSVVGGKESIEAGLEKIIAETAADEIIVTGSMYDHRARLGSFDIVAGAFEEINKRRSRTEAPAAYPEL